MNSMDKEKNDILDLFLDPDTAVEIVEQLEAGKEE